MHLSGSENPKAPVQHPDGSFTCSRCGLPIDKDAWREFSHPHGTVRCRSCHEELKAGME